MSVMAGATDTLQDAITGGIWSSSLPGIASVDPVTGIVTGLSAGTASISYTLGTVFTTIQIYVTPAGAAAKTTGVNNNAPNGSTIDNSIPGAVTNMVTLPSPYDAGPGPGHYIRTFTPLIPIADASTIDETSPSASVMMSTAYTDGFVRVLENIKRYATADADVIQSYDYRPSNIQYSYLPYSIAGNSGFQLSPFQDQQNYYNNLYPDEGGMSMGSTVSSSTSSSRTASKYLPGKSSIGQFQGSQTSINTNVTNDIINPLFQMFPVVPDVPKGIWN
jgi:hypothetical protein